MKKLIASIALASISTMASAEWSFLADAADGDRLLFRNGSLEVVKNKHDLVVASAVFMMVSNKQPFRAVIAVDSCINGSGQMILGGDNATKDVWWSKDGSMLYDMAGYAMCSALAGGDSEDSDAKDKITF